MNNIQLPEWAEDLFSDEYRYFALFGGRGCVHPDTLLDTPNGKVKIKDWRGGPIYSYKDGEVIETYATPSIEGTKEDLYEVTLSNGLKVTCTDEHKFRTFYDWKMLKDIDQSDSYVLTRCKQYDFCQFHSIESVKYFGCIHYWDLHVPETNCYFANGILHHNSSKSHSVAMALVLMAAQRPIRILCAREVQKSIRDSVKRLLDDKIEAAGFQNMFKSTDTEIRGTNGSLFIFAGLQHNIASIKSMEGINLCWVEEAQTLSKSSLDTLIPTVFRREDSKIFFTWNPRDPKDPVDVMFKGEEGPPPKSLVKCVNYKDNPWFPEPLREEMEHDKLKDRGKYLHVWEGEYLVRSNANVFQDWRIEDFETPDDAFFRFGCDWGFSVDPTVLVRCYTVGRKLYIDYEAYQVGCEIDDTPDLFATVPESDRWPIIADSASPERISYMRKHGYPKIMKAVKGRKSIEEGIAFLQSFEIIVHPRCEHTIYEMEHYSYRVDPITDEITNVLSDKDNHMCVAEWTNITTRLNGIEGRTPIQCFVDYPEGQYPEVLTRGGWQKVYAFHDNGVKKVITIATTHGDLSCTPDHEILTSRGWLRADAIRCNDEILYIGEHPCPQRESSLTDSNKEDAQSQICDQTGNTSSELFLEDRPSSIEISGNIIMDLYHLVTTYTTRMEIAVITKLITLSAYLLRNMSGNIGRKREAMLREAIWSLSDHLPKSGTPLERAWSGTKNMVTTFGKKEKSEKAPASSVTSNSLTRPSPTSANQHGVEIKDWMMLTAHASHVNQSLGSINTASRELAVGRVLTVSDGKEQRVFDLSVENFQEFIANGALVANCDALRYACESVRRTTKAKKRPDFTPLPTKNFWG